MYRNDLFLQLGILNVDVGNHCNAIWTLIVQCVWALGAFHFFTIKYIAANQEHIAPFMLIAYAIATGPWAYMASKEAHVNEYSSFSVFFLQLACASFLILRLTGFFFTTQYLVFFAIILGGFILSWVFGAVMALIESRD